MRLDFKDERKRCCSLVRCMFSITKMMSAYSTSSAVSGVSASALVPAEATSMSFRVAKTCSAVALRNRFWLQTNKTLGMVALLRNNFDERV